MNQHNFIPRKFKNEKSNNSISFDEVVNNSSISIILGEPASGKTFQLEKFNFSNQNSMFIELITIDDEDDIEEDIEIVLLDSIDEALSKNDSDKILVKKLIKYIKRCKVINPNVKFVISCRYVEWKEIFENRLEEIDKEFQVYSIEELSQEDINSLLINNGIDKDEFWNFIKVNYLEQLLKNILMTIHIIENFDKYKDEELKYIDIYKKIIEEHLLAETENERKKQLKEISLEDMVKISSIIAIYMTLNRTRTISIERITQLADEFYLLDGVEITGKKLEIVFDTALFSGNRKNIRFFHKSVQEYLTACFIDLKQLDIETIQKIFAHQLRFYEEFEEVIIYLTNIEPKYFNFIVDFDPFIFRRHPSLTEEQQEKLLISIIYIFQNNTTMAWGKSEKFYNTTLTKFDKIKDISQVIKKEINIENIDELLFSYLLDLLEDKYSKGLENVIFEILDVLVKNKKNSKKIIQYKFIQNFSFNKRLFYFMKKHELFEKHDYSYNTFELKLFESLYGFSDNKYNQKPVSRTDFDFIECIYLLDYIPSENFEGLLPNILKEDVEIWVNWFLENFAKYKEENDLLIWIIFLFLKNEIDIVRLIDFLSKNEIYFYSHDITKEMILESNQINDNFWNFFFNVFNDLIKNNNKNYTIKGIYDFYSLSVEYIEQLTIQYPIEKYPFHYEIIAKSSEPIKDFLMQNQLFNSYIIEIDEKHKIRNENLNKKMEVRLVRQPNQIDSVREFAKEQYSFSIKSLKTEQDYLNVWNHLLFNHNKDFFKKAEEDLKENYIKFIEWLQGQWENDISYLLYKTDITNNVSSITPHTKYTELFNTFSDEKLEKIIYSDELYEKLFWYGYNDSSIFNEKYFQKLSQKYFDTLIELILEVMILSLKQSNYTNIGEISSFINLLKQMDRFYQNDLKDIIDFILILDFKILYESSQVNTFEFILLIYSDSQYFDFIEKLLFSNEERLTHYLSILWEIDSNKTIKLFYEKIYSKINRYVKLSTEGKINLLKPYIDPKFDNILIEPRKREVYSKLLTLLKGKKLSIQEKYIEMILVDYYEFYKEQIRTETAYTANKYDDMSRVINNIFNQLEDLKYIEFLKKLTQSKLQRLRDSSKYILEKAYNLQLKNREFNNNYYKNILDNYENQQDRFFNYEKLRDDLIEISLIETKNRNAIFKESEDETNDRFRNALHYKNYNVTDQSRGGESSSGINAGERDLVVCNEQGLDESVIEAFILKSLDSTVINKHYEKLVKRYDTSGNRVNFVLVYSKTKNFDELWEKYIEFDGFNNFVDTQDEYSQKDNVRVGVSEYKKMKVYHLFINFYSYANLTTTN